MRNYAKLIVHSIQYGFFNEEFLKMDFASIAIHFFRYHDRLTTILSEQFEANHVCDVVVPII